MPTDPSIRHEPEPPEPTISLEARASVPYPEIAAQALAALETRPLPIDAGVVRGQVHVVDVRVRASGVQLAVAVAFRAELAWPLPRVRGTLDVSATPTYDGEAQTVRLSDVTVTADVDHVVARAAFALKRAVIVDALNRMSFDIGPRLRDLQDRLNAGLSGLPLAPGIVLQGRVETLRVTDILLAEALVVVASASGRLVVVSGPRGLD